MQTLFTIILLLLASFIVLSIYLSHLVVHPKTHSVKETYEYELNAGWLKAEEFDKLHKEEVYIDSPYGYKLFGLFFPAQGSKKAIIICHGITWTLFGAVKYLDLFLKWGFNVLIYDHRNHGRSGGRHTTFGFYEKNDLKACTDWIVSRCGDDCKIGTLGESMGAAVALQNTAIDERLSFCIADCPYSDLETLFRVRAKEDFHLPFFPFIPASSFVTRLIAGMSFKDVSPLHDIQRVKTPIFFIHGQNDTYIPKEMSIDLYNLKQGTKKLYLAPNAGHVESYFKNRDEYGRQINDFLTEIGII